MSDQIDQDLRYATDEVRHAMTLASLPYDVRSRASRFTKKSSAFQPGDACEVLRVLVLIHMH